MCNMFKEEKNEEWEDGMREQMWTGRIDTEGR